MGRQRIFAQCPAVQPYEELECWQGQTFSPLQVLWRHVVYLTISANLPQQAGHVVWLHDVAFVVTGIAKDRTS